MFQVKNLNVAFKKGNARWILANREINISIREGIRYAIIGESGCGKSVMVKSALGYLESDNSTSINGQVQLFGKDINTLSKKELHNIRKQQLFYIPQENLTALDPLFTAEEIVKSRARIAYESKNGMSLKAVLKKVEKEYQELNACGLSFTREQSDTTRRISWTPVSDYSGGMRQITFVSKILLVKPRLLVLDEVSTALDNIKEHNFFKILMDKVWKPAKDSENKMSILIISHNIGLARNCADFVYVMYAGTIVEAGPVQQVLEHPKHPYTKLLILSQPKINRSIYIHKKSWGEPPDNYVNVDILDEDLFFHKKCPFLQRCPDGQQCIDMKMPEKKTVDDGSFVRCHFPIKTFTEIKPRIYNKTFNNNKNLLSLRNISVFARGKRIISDLFLEVNQGESVGIVGGSGHGKSTLVKAILRLPGYVLDSRNGSAEYLGQNLHTISNNIFRKQVQYVAQIVNDAFLKSFTAGEVVLEPLFIDFGDFKDEIKKKTNILDKAFSDVGLEISLASEKIDSLSGGQQQRISIARALVALQIYSTEKIEGPRLMILDEPTSSLDVTIQAGILTLLQDLQKEYGLSYLFISHDLNVVKSFCPSINVIYHGTFVENFLTEEILNQDFICHPYTANLFGLSEIRVDMVPDFNDKFEGCSYYKNCPMRIAECEKRKSDFVSVNNFHKIACRIIAEKKNRREKNCIGVK